MSSVVTEWETYAFTMMAASLLTAAGTLCLMVSLFKRSESQRQHWPWVVYDGLMAMLALITVGALRRRLADMEHTTQLLIAEYNYVDLMSAYDMHVICVDCASTLIAAALLKLSKPWWPDVSESRHLSLSTAIFVIAVSGGVASSHFTELLGAGAAVLILFNLVIVGERFRVPLQIYSFSLQNLLKT